MLRSDIFFFLSRKSERWRKSEDPVRRKCRWRLRQSSWTARDREVESPWNKTRKEAERGTETSAEDLVGPPRADGVENRGPTARGW
jgi:hypothetical protein